MGLDITYHRTATPVPEDVLADVFANVDEDDRPDVAYERGWAIPWVNDDFPAQADGVEHRRPYVVSGTESFCAGSYGGYYVWRQRLAAMRGIDDIEAWWRADGDDGPFAALLHFSDCEGVIGPKTSARLHADFVAHHDQARAHAATMGGGQGQYWLGKYEQWMQAFDAARNGGFVDFH